MSIDLRNRLRESENRLVLAESCTSGLVAALLGSLPGISEVFCGSFVVYRTKSKEDWLDLPKELLEDPKRGPVSAEATLLLCHAILKRTPEATIGAAITGHLGPIENEANQRGPLDGKIFIALIKRSDLDHPICKESVLRSPPCKGTEDVDGRTIRQREAAEFLLGAIAEAIQ